MIYCKSSQKFHAERIWKLINQLWSGEAGTPWTRNTHTHIVIISWLFDRLRSWWSPQICADTSTPQRSSPLGEEAVAGVWWAICAGASRVLWCFCREGSVVAHFWLRLWVPVSRVETVSVARLNESVFRELQRFTDAQQICRYEGFQLLMPSLSFTGDSSDQTCVMTSAAFLFSCFYCFMFFFFTFQKPAPKL